MIVDAGEKTIENAGRHAVLRRLWLGLRAPLPLSGRLPARVAASDAYGRPGLSGRCTGGRSSSCSAPATTTSLERCGRPGTSGPCACSG